MATTTSPARLRGLYRSLLRELPPRPVLSLPRAPLHAQLRAAFSPVQSGGGGGGGTDRDVMRMDVDTAAEMVGYLRAQRTYVTLLERYNPGARDGDVDDGGEAERVRLTARRVGMNLPRTVRS